MEEALLILQEQARNKGVFPERGVPQLDCPQRARVVPGWQSRVAQLGGWGREQVYSMLGGREGVWGKSKGEM